ncbi:hypothetical protein LEP1GSC085_2336 [Leptospira interrogans str. L0996]|nr:hypothetical protein LEP1GSC085_2336 [Leptospira interrogans str. L0996]
MNEICVYYNKLLVGTLVTIALKFTFKLKEAGLLNDKDSNWIRNIIYTKKGFKTIRRSYLTLELLNFQSVFIVWKRLIEAVLLI